MSTSPQPNGPALAPTPEAHGRYHALAGLVPHVVHDLNNRLFVLVGALELLLHEEQNPERKKRLDAASDEARLCSRLLNEMSQFASASGAGSGAIDLRAILASAEALFAPVARTARQELEVRVEGRSLPIEGDPVRLLHAVVALLQDTLDGPQPRRSELSGRGPGRIRVRAFRTGFSRSGATVLSVAHARAPEAPAIGGGAAPRSEPGSGGRPLEQAAAIAADHQARLRVRSFGPRLRALRIAFPSLAGGSGAAEIAPARRHGRAILVAEGDGILSDLLVEVLSQSGYRVATASRPGELQSRLAERPWDLLLCDVELVRPPGVLAPAAPTPDHPVRTAYMASRSLEGEGELEDAPVIYKPFRPHELLSFVRELLQ